MPQKNNLTFTAPEAPFLKNLRGQGSDDAPRVSAYGAGRMRSKKGPDEDDGPLVLDEAGNEVSRAEMERMERGEDGEEDEGEKDDSGKGEKGADMKAAKEGKESKDDVKFGAGKKRKAGKVVAVEDGDAGVVQEKAETKANEGARKGTSKGDEAKAPAKKNKKQKVALSFGDDGD